jgi:putative transposase
MTYDPEKHHRHSIRLQGYDYSAGGLYFVTICTYQRDCLFGEIIAREMVLNDFGKIVATEWQKSSSIRQEVELDAWVIMPNHMHGVVKISNTPTVGANGGSPNAESIASNPSIKPIGWVANKEGERRSPLREMGFSMKPRSLSLLVAGLSGAENSK